MKQGTIIKCLVILNLLVFVWDLLIILNMVKIREYKTSDLVFSLFIVILVGSLIKHRYWVIAFVYQGLQSVAKFITTKFFVTFYYINNPFGFLIMIAGMICSLLASFYFYKLLKVRGFNFKENIRLRDLDNYLKKKLHQ